MMMTDINIRQSSFLSAPAAASVSKEDGMLTLSAMGKNLSVNLSSIEKGLKSVEKLKIFAPPQLRLFAQTVSAVCVTIADTIKDSRFIEM